MNLLEKIFFTILLGSAFCVIPFIVIAVLYKYEMPLIIDVGVVLACVFICLIKIFIEIWRN